MSYSIDKTDIHSMLNVLTKIFDIARVVDPLNRKVFEFDDKGSLKTKETCHKVWGKDKRCENCVSHRALNTDKKINKFEFIEEEVYNVNSIPITINNSDENINCVLELVNKVTDDIAAQSFNKGDMLFQNAKAVQMTYKDSQTSTYNKRYYDDLLFCHREYADISEHVSFLTVKVNDLDKIAEEYGYEIENVVLVRIGIAIKSNIPKTFSIIRYDFDTFLVVCVDDDSDYVIENHIDKIKEQINKIKYDSELNKYVTAKFGIAKTDKFSEDKAFVDSLLNQSLENLT